MQAKVNETEVVKDTRARSNICWGCGKIGHFYKDCSVTSTVIESKDDPTQMTKAVIYNYILYYIQKTIHSKHICKNVHS